MIQKLLALSAHHRMIRGMVSYAIIWPGSCLVEQTFLEHRNIKTYDWKKCFRYSLFGAFVIAPTMFFWVRLAAIMWPKVDFPSSLSKGLAEQLALDPLGITLFLFTMGLMEGKQYPEAKKEVRQKFLSIYEVGIIYWPTVQTVNFRFVPIRNQVVVTSFFSFIWTSYLAYIKTKEQQEQIILGE